MAVYEHISTTETDHSRHPPTLKKRNMEDPANIIDLVELLDELADHYAGDSMDFFESNDLRKDDDKILVSIFYALADWYSLEEGEDLNPYSFDLYMIYDELAVLFENSSKMTTSNGSAVQKKPYDPN